MTDFKGGSEGYPTEVSDLKPTNTATDMEAPASNETPSLPVETGNHQDHGIPNSAAGQSLPLKETGDPFLRGHDDEATAPTRSAVASLRSDPWRFSVALIFCILSFSNAMQWTTFSPIVAEVRIYFHMNASQVNFLSTTYVISYVLIVFLSCKLYEVMGIKFGVLVAAGANVLGAVLKLIALYAWPNAVLLYIAQVINSFTEVLTIATPPLIANRWFPEGERVVACTVMASALNFGCGVGVLLPTFFVSPEKYETRHFGSLFWFHFGLCAAVFVVAIFAFPKKPRFNASHVAARQQGGEDARLRKLHAVLQRKSSVSQHDATGGAHDSHHQAGEHGDDDAFDPAHLSSVNPPYDVDVDKEEPEVEPVNVFSVLLDCFREFRKNFSFICLSVGSAAELGLIWGMAIVLPQMLAPYGISEATSGWIGFLNLVLGTVVCPFCMPLVDRYGRRYKLILCSLAVVLVISMVLLTLLLHFRPAGPDASRYCTVVAFVLWGGVAGLCLNFMMPLLFEYVIELTFPMSESTSAPVLTWAACLSNLVLALIFGAVLTDNPTEKKSLHVFIGATVTTVIGAIALFLTSPTQKRQDYELQTREGLARQQQLEEQQHHQQMLEGAESMHDGGISHTGSELGAPSMGDQTALDHKVPCKGAV